MDVSCEVGDGAVRIERAKTGTSSVRHTLLAIWIEVGTVPYPTAWLINDNFTLPGRFLRRIAAVQRHQIEQCGDTSCKARKMPGPWGASDDGFVETRSRKEKVHVGNNIDRRAGARIVWIADDFHRIPIHRLHCIRT